MAKRSEANAKFDNLENMINNWYELREEEEKSKVEHLDDMVAATKRDMTSAGYGGTKSKSETLKVLNKINTYSESVGELCQKTENQIKSEFEKLANDLYSKYKVTLLPGEDDSYTDPFFNFPEGNSEIEKKARDEYNKWLKGLDKSPNIGKIKDKINAIGKIYKDFQTTLEKQMKRKILGHISRFCNEDATETLKKVQLFLKEYAAVMVERWS